MFFNIETDAFYSSGIEKIAERMYNFNNMEKCVRLQKSTHSCKTDTLTITWHFRKSPLGSGMWQGAFHIPLPPLFR